MLNYNAPADGVKSSIDGAGSDQMNTFFYLKKALIDARKEQYFTPLASTINMPKHFGKKIKAYVYVPLLDERNVNSQGIDAAGVTTAHGNLYGSSKDIGLIVGRLPTLTENGGRVNRVGFTRLDREGTLQKMGFFHDFTDESMNFDSDEQLMSHLSRELMNGAVQASEAFLQADLLSNAGTVFFSGSATTNATMSGEGAVNTHSIVSYALLSRLSQELTDNRTPKQTTVITGSRLTDTRVIPGGRVLYVGSEVVPILKGMKDLHNAPAFIGIQHYADAGNALNGEIGSIDEFRIVLVPEMLNWAGVGATATTNPSNYRTSLSGGVQKYDVFPLLCVGEDSFATIGFQTDGKSLKFNVLTKMPGRETADRVSDPYGETGFSSIKWYYGFLGKRPERIGLIKTVAPR